MICSRSSPRLWSLPVIGLLQPRRSGLPARMAEFVSIRGLQQDKGERQAPPRRTTTEQHEDASGRGSSETLEIADIKVSPGV